MILLIVLIGIGLNRLVASGKRGIQTQFCFENLRQAQRGLELYSQDYDQTLPKAAAWMDAATPYVKGQTDFKCPVVRVTDPTGFGYAFNTKLSAMKKAKIEAPASTALLYDSTNLARNAADAITSLPAPPRHVLQRFRPRRNAPRNGNSIVFADGHVRLVALDGSSPADPSTETNKPSSSP